MFQNNECEKMVRGHTSSFNLIRCNLIKYVLWRFFFFFYKHHRQIDLKDKKQTAVDCWFMWSLCKIFLPRQYPKIYTRWCYIPVYNKGSPEAVWIMYISPIQNCVLPHIQVFWTLDCACEHTWHNAGMCIEQPYLCPNHQYLLLLRSFFSWRFSWSPCEDLNWCYR